MKSKKVLILVITIVLCLSSKTFSIHAQNYESNVIESVFNMYDARNNNNFDKFINSFYFADLLSQNDIETLKGTFYHERVHYTVEPLAYTRTSDTTALFTYYEINRLRANNNRFALISSKVTATLNKKNNDWKIYQLDYIESMPFTIPQDIVTTHYQAKNNKDFDTYLNSFYFADLIDASTIATLRQTFYMETPFTFNYEIQPVDLIVKDSNNVEFVYYETQTITTSSAKLVQTTEMTAILKIKNSVWKIESFVYGPSKYTIERY